MSPILESKMIQLLGLASMAFVVAFTIRAYYKDPTSGQSPRESIIEAWVNIVIGFAINFAANLVVIPLMTGATLSLAANFWGGWIYTSIAIVRQYAIRRWFNNRIHELAKRLAHT